MKRRLYITVILGVLIGIPLISFTSWALASKMTDDMHEYKVIEVTYITPDGEIKTYRDTEADEIIYKDNEVAKLVYDKVFENENNDTAE